MKKDDSFLSPWQIRVLSEDSDSIQLLIVYRDLDNVINEIVMDFQRSYFTEKKKKKRGGRHEVSPCKSETGKSITKS